MSEASNPIVSVVIPTYNRKKTVGRAIQSALNQSFKNLEIVVLDDGSTDGTNEVVAGYLHHPNIRYIYQNNQGSLDKTMNNLVRATRGKYIAPLDDDDFWCDADKIKKQVEFLEKNPAYVLVGGGAIKIDQNGKEIVRYLVTERDQDIRQKILMNNAFVHVSTLYKKDAWEKVGGYDEDLDGGGDWDLWMKLGQVGKFYNMQEFFVKYSGHQQDNPGYCETRYGRQGWFQLNVRLRKKHRHQYPHYSQALVLCWLGYGYSFLPFKRRLWPLVFKIRSFLFRNSPYRYYKSQ